MFQSVKFSVKKINQLMEVQWLKVCNFNASFPSPKGKMYFVFHAEIPVVGNEFTCEGRLVQPTFLYLVIVCSQSMYNHLLGMFSFVGVRTTICASLSLCTVQGLGEDCCEIQE